MEAVTAGDATGWFEKLYAEAQAGGPVVPWADGEPNPNLLDWADATSLNGAGPGGAARTALVPGCGLGYDAEFLARRGFAVTAFDISPTAVAAAKRENPGSAVRYVTADL